MRAAHEVLSHRDMNILAELSPNHYLTLLYFLALAVHFQGTGPPFNRINSFPNSISSMTISLLGGRMGWGIWVHC